MTKIWEGVASFLSRSWPFWVLTLVVGSIAITNAPPSGWLTGWDNLHPEFDFEMNVGRSVSSVWQEYQGVGLLGGMGHAADLFRQLAIWAVSLLLPTSWLRYGFHILMLFVGMTGMYVLIHNVALTNTDNGTKKIGSLLGSLYYGLSLGSILYFYAPFEPYSTFWGMFPWEIFSLIQYLNNSNKKNLVTFFVVHLLAVAQGYVQTLFLVYGMCAAIMVLAYVMRERSWISAKKSLSAGLIILVANAFWVLPAAHYVASSVEDHNNAQQISFSTEMFYLMNKGRGTLKDFVEMKLFYFDFTDWNKEGNGFNYFAPEWVSHYERTEVIYVAYALTLLIVIGMLVAFPYKFAFLAVLFTGLIAFLSSEPVFSTLNEVMRKNELFAQLFRNPYTKLIVPTVAVMSVLFGVGVGKIYYLVSKYINRYLGAIVVATVVVGLTATSVPVWRGQYFYDSEKTQIPSEYFRLFDYFKDSADKNGRVALLPAHYMWGWSNHDWGYRGSGFLWYGIEQPILDRAFDVWSKYNESFYLEFTDALYSGDGAMIEKVLAKYGVRYALLDTSVVDSGLQIDVFKYEGTKALIDRLGYKITFTDNYLTVWDRGEQSDAFVSAPVNYTWVEGGADKVRRDVAWEGVGNYVTSNKLTQQQTNATTTYPFSQLMREEIKGVEYGEGKVTISYEETPPAFGVPTRDSLASPIEESPQIIIPGWQVGDIVRINYRDGQPLPAYKVNGQDGPVFLGKEKPEEGKSYIVARVSEGEEWGEYLQDARFPASSLTSQGHSQIKIEVAGEPQVYDFSKQGQGTIGNCDVLKRGVAEKQDSKYSADERGAVCDYVVMPELDTRLSYLMRMQGENIEGRSLKFFLYNTGSKRNDIEYLLGKNTYDQTFSLLPWSFDGTYTLNIETRSFGQYAENRVDPVELWWLPLEQITGARIISTNGETPPASGVPTRDSLWSPVEESPQVRSDLLVTEVKKYGTWLYIVETKNGGLLKLSQGYDEGWVSPYLEHVKVDGWANGWIVPAGEHQIIIFYWPQLLQYLGFVMLGVTIIVLVRHKD